MNNTALTQIFILMLCLGGCAEERHVVGKDVKYGTNTAPFGFLNVHSSDVPWIEVKGKRFSNLAGFAPYHLEIPGTDRLFFIKMEGPLGPDRPKYTYHFFSLSKGDVIFKDQLPLFANSLGRKFSPKFYMKINEVSEDVILVTERTENVMGYYRFDLKDLTVKQSSKDL